MGQTSQFKVLKFQGVRTWDIPVLVDYASAASNLQDIVSYRGSDTGYALQPLWQ